VVSSFTSGDVKEWPGRPQRIKDSLDQTVWSRQHQPRIGRASAETARYPCCGPGRAMLFLSHSRSAVVWVTTLKQCGSIFKTTARSRRDSRFNERVNFPAKACRAGGSNTVGVESPLPHRRLTGISRCHSCRVVNLLSNHRPACSLRAFPSVYRCPAQRNCPRRKPLWKRKSIGRWPP
jgi:hypothetical protein